MLLTRAVYMDTLPLAQALWWFIENIFVDDSERTALFFHLRERYIREVQIPTTIVSTRRIL